MYIYIQCIYVQLLIQDYVIPWFEKCVMVFIFNIFGGLIEKKTIMGRGYLGLIGQSMAKQIIFYFMH